MYIESNRLDLIPALPSLQTTFSSRADAVIYHGDCLDLLATIPSSSVGLVVTSPPYNIGKEYERRSKLDSYIKLQEKVIEESVRVLSPTGSICWQVGNYVDKGAIIPLDTLLYPIFAKLGLKMRNRIIWHFEHGLHCTGRFSGRYETIMWFTKTDKYFFDVDPIRVPQKYPGKKHFKGPKAGEYSGNPLGKNPGDVWVIPNVKSNHVEKTGHPCQFPVELIERLVLSMTQPGDWVVDPFLGSGTSLIAALKHERKGAGADTDANYCGIAKERFEQLCNGTLRTREMGLPVFNPADAGKSLTESPWAKKDKPDQIPLLERRKAYGSK